MLIFGYDQFIDGEATTNGFKFVGKKSPINLGVFGYKRMESVRDRDLNLIPERLSPFHQHHYFGLRKHFNIEVKKVSEIKDRYYYVIDVFPNEFWTSMESRYPNNISGQAISDIKSGRAKILILFPLEPIRDNIDVSGLLNTWAANYSLPSRSIVVVSGNYSFGNQINKDKCIVYIPYSMWEHMFCSMLTSRRKQMFVSAIENKISRKKVFLSYNRRARPHRCRLVYLLEKSGSINSGLVSLGNMDGPPHPEIPNDFYKKLPMPFDDTDLEINHAVELVEKDFLNSYVSLVSETEVGEGNIFPTEKIFKAIVGMHPFIVLAAPGFLEKLKGVGYKTFSKWFSEEYDLEKNLEKRIAMISYEIKKLTLKSDSELQQMLFSMLPLLKDNLNNFVKRTKEKTFQKELENELWR